MEVAPLNHEVAECPEDGAAYWITADDKVRLRVAIWQNQATNKGTIFLFPGRSEFIEKFGRTTLSFLNHGYATFIIDWRGQGLSDRLASDTRLGHVNRFSHYQNDVSAMMKAATLLDLPKPWYLFGHSMGGNIGLRSLIESSPVVASAFTAPMWGINIPLFVKILAKPLSRLIILAGQGEMYTRTQKGESYALFRSFEENSITHDRDMYNYYIRQANAFPEAHIGAASITWLYEALVECKRLDKIQSPDVPCITFIAEHDSTVENYKIENRMDAWPKSSCAFIKNAKHDILGETPNIRNMVIRNICNFFEQHS